MERGLLVLRNFLDLAVELGSRRLIDAAGLRETCVTDRLENAQHARRIDVRRKFRRIERHLHVTLRREVVHLVRTHRRNHTEDRTRVTEVAIVKMEVRTALEMGNAFAEIHRAATNDAMDVVALLKQEFRKVGTVLTRDTSNERFLHEGVLTCWFRRPVRGRR